MSTSHSITAAFFDRFCQRRFWSSSTLPRPVCLARVVFISYFVVLRGVLLCCVCCTVCCVTLHCNPLCCVALRCVCFVALRCVAIRCVTVVLYLLSCIVLCCAVDKFSISSIPSMLKLYISKHTQPTSLLADNLYTRQLDKLNHPYQMDKLNIFHLL